MALDPIFLSSLYKRHSVLVNVRNDNWSPLSASRLLGRAAVMPLFLLLVSHVTVAQSLPGINAQTMTPIPGVGHNYLKILDDTVDPSSGSLSSRSAFPFLRAVG